MANFTLAIPAEHGRLQTNLIGTEDNPLVPKTSAAIAESYGDVKLGAKVQKREWKVTDTGGGLDDKQIDLYWGEAKPEGPGRRVTKPKGAPSEITDPTVKVIKRESYFSIPE